MTRGQLPQRAGSLGLNGGGTAAAVLPSSWPSYSSSGQVSLHVVHRLDAFLVAESTTSLVPSLLRSF